MKHAKKATGWICTLILLCSMLSMTVLGKRNLEKSEIASISPIYMPVESIGTYDDSIITDELLNKESTLPEATQSNIPYWTGFVTENKISANFSDGRWDPKTDGSHYFYEEQVKFLSENGFNCLRTVYSLSFLSNPDNPKEVNLSELLQLDELIAWGIKHDVHIMLSITGLPNRKVKDTIGWDEEAVAAEMVNRNGDLFEDKELQELYSSYMTMIAKRYAEIPNKFFSIELIVEAEMPHCDDPLKLYQDVLTPMVKEIFAVSPERILIVNDVYKMVPEELAKLGCSLSLHNHNYFVSKEYLENGQLSHTGYDPKWPMTYFPERISKTSGKLVLESETQYQGGELKIYLVGGVINVSMDKNYSKDYCTEGIHDPIIIPIKDGTKTITIGNVEYPDGNTDIGDLGCIEIYQNNELVSAIVPHNVWMCSWDEKQPHILVKEDGSLVNIDEPQKELNSQYITDTYLNKFINVAKKYNVGFLLTEVGTDTRDLSKEEYYAYEGTWLKALKDSKIPWMYNCLHGALAPELTHDDVQRSCGLEDIESYKDTILYQNNDVLELLIKYQ